MKRRGHASQMVQEGEIDMTPMLDVVFIMLIFFVVTASFVKESGIDIQRPTASSAVAQQQANIFVAISSEGEVWIDNRNVDIRSLRAIVERLHSESPEGSVVIQSDAATRTDLLVKVMDQVRLAGVDRIALAATEDEG